MTADEAQELALAAATELDNVRLGKPVSFEAVRRLATLLDEECPTIENHGSFFEGLWESVKRCDGFCGTKMDELTEVIRSKAEQLRKIAEDTNNEAERQRLFAYCLELFDQLSNYATISFRRYFAFA